MFDELLAEQVLANVVASQANAQVAPNIGQSVDPLEEAIRERAMAALGGKIGGGGGGRIPAAPIPIIDYAQMLSGLAQQPITSTYTPRTLGMNIGEVQSQYAPIIDAMNQQMQQMQQTGLAANQQQEQNFDNEAKRWQMGQQAANAGRSELAQYLSMAHQMASDRRRDAMLDRQLRRDEVLQRQRDEELQIRRESLDSRNSKLSEETKRIAAYVPSLKTPGVDSKELTSIINNQEYGPLLMRRIATQWKNMDADLIRSTPAQKDAAARSIVQEFVKEIKANPERVLAQTPNETYNASANDPEALIRKALFGEGL